MAGKSARRGRVAIAASFVVQAAFVAVLVTDSAGGSASSAVPAGPVPAQQGAAGAVPSAASAPPPPAAAWFPPGVIPVVVSAADQSGATVGSGDIGFPMPEDPPRLVIQPGTQATLTVDVTIPPGSQARGLWLGVATEQGGGAPRPQIRLLTVSKPLSPGPHVFTLHWALPAGTPPGTGGLLIMDVQHPARADAAPIAELVAG